MSGRFAAGETKVRPGVYFREENGGGAELMSERNGIVAVAFRANWGPLGEVVSLTSPAEIAAYYGNDEGENSNVSILNKVFLGGASEIKAIRVGAGGTKASITLKSEGDADAVTLTAKYAGTRELNVTIRDSLAVSTQRECIICTGTTVLSKITFAKGGSEVDALVAAINGNDAVVVTAAKAENATGALAACVQTVFSTAGASPEVTNADYDNAFSVLEAAKWNALCVDSNDTALHALVKSFIDRANDAGLMAVAILGEPTSVDFATRKANSAAFNSCNVVYCLNGFKLAGEVHDGYKAAAVLAGLIAYLPANDSPTHKVIPNASEVVGALTNAQIIECLQSGALVFTVSASGAVWVEQGINTLVTLGVNQDAGWKKIRRTKTRFELMQRINISCEGLIGSINNDSNGRATVIAIANGVINAMIAEGKLVAGAIYEDTANPARGDSAWFVVDVLDLDSIEHLYITYRFRFSDD